MVVAESYTHHIHQVLVIFRSCNDVIYRLNTFVVIIISYNEDLVTFSQQQ